MAAAANTNGGSEAEHASYKRLPTVEQVKKGRVVPRLGQCTARRSIKLSVAQQLLKRVRGSCELIVTPIGS